MSCACGTTWRFEACDLATGTVRAVLHPLSADWQTILNEPGRGTLVLPTRDVKVRDIFPHLSSVYCLRLEGGSATPETPVVEGAFMIEQFSADDNGATQVGMKGLEEYLNRRKLRSRFHVRNRSQTDIARILVSRAQPDGIPLFAEAAPSERTRRRTYEAFERKNIGEALKQLTEVINGPDWELRHEKTEGRWSTTMIFRDEVGTTRELTLRSDREANGYGLEVDATEHATLVDALGQGEEDDMLIATAEDEASRYPRFDAAPAWKDTSEPDHLQEQSDGYLAEHKDPFAMPSVTLPGLDPDPARTQLGDTVNVNTNYGAVTYRGPARIISRAWRIGEESPAERTFEFVPLTDAAEAILSQQPDDDCKDCD